MSFNVKKKKLYYPVVHRLSNWYSSLLVRSRESTWRSVDCSLTVPTFTRALFLQVFYPEKHASVSTAGYNVTSWHNESTTAASPQTHPRRASSYSQLLLAGLLPMCVPVPTQSMVFVWMQRAQVLHKFEINMLCFILVAAIMHYWCNVDDLCMHY